MNTNLLCRISAFRLALCASVALFTHPMFSQTWQTVDSFQYIAGDNAWNRGLGAAPSGTIFAYGIGSTSTNKHALVMASADDGTTWSAPLDDLSSVWFAPACDGHILASDAQGTLYYAVQTQWAGEWVVRQGTAGGTAWATVDDHTFADSGYASYLNGICTDPSGNVYVVGVVNYTNGIGPDTWTVRKGVGGTSYSTVDSYSPYGYAWPHAVFAHPNAGVFVVGRADYPVIVHNKQSIGAGWTVRRSQDGGATWANVDQLANCAAYGIGAGAHGNLYVVGQFNVSNIGVCWLVRKSTDGGNTWTTVDTYQLAAGYAAQAQCFVADSAGNLFVAGWADTGPSERDWIVRENPGGNGAWSVVDEVPNGQAETICADASGHVFVGGSAPGGGGWTVRRN